MARNIQCNLTLGALPLSDDHYQFKVWAPFAESLDLELITRTGSKLLPMRKEKNGYFVLNYEIDEPNARYYYVFNKEKKFPDPSSRYQPEGVHGPSQLIKFSETQWDPHWQSKPLSQYIIYELHVGTYTEAGTFAAIIPHLDELARLGITAIELMPVAQYSGNRNWGYDGTYPFAVQNSYGGPHELRKLLAAAHERQIAVILDVVYNHLGPEGNYLGNFGPYFTDQYHTPWGKALNFDQAWSNQVRRYFIENALYWLTDFHIDALRLDAVHAIFDQSAYTFLRELADHVAALNKLTQRSHYLIAESDLNDIRIILPSKKNGFGIDAQWSDDFHHALVALMTGERNSYYQDFGQLSHLAKAYREGFVYSGQYSPHRKRNHGISSKKIPGQQFIVCSQNHDQIGNRLFGDRLTASLDFPELKLIAALVICSPYIPLLFMGEEYGELAPFQFFVSHSDPELIKLVREGRKREFAWQDEIPDPQAEEIFLKCKLNHHLKMKGHHHEMYLFYKALLKLRRSLPALANLNKKTMKLKINHATSMMQIQRYHQNQTLLLLCHFNKKNIQVRLNIPTRSWQKILSSHDEKWSCTLSQTPTIVTNRAEITLLPFEFVLYLSNDTNEDME